jgi:hypothetical protein
MQLWFSVRRLPQRWRPMFLWKLNTYLLNYIVLQYHLSIKLHSITVSPIYQTALSQYHLSNYIVTVSPIYETVVSQYYLAIKLHSVTASPIKLHGVTVSPIKLHTFTFQKKGVLIVISITVSDCMNVDKQVLRVCWGLDWSGSGFGLLVDFYVSAVQLLGFNVRGWVRISFATEWMVIW